MNTYKVGLFPWQKDVVEKTVKADRFEVTCSGALVFFHRQRQQPIRAFNTWVQLHCGMQMKLLLK